MGWNCELEEVRVLDWFHFDALKLVFYYFQFVFAVLLKVCSHYLSCEPFTGCIKVKYD